MRLVSHHLYVRLQARAEYFNACNGVDRGVWDPPPSDIIYCETTGEAELAAKKLAEEYRELPPPGPIFQ